jgi:hypothetical protein
VITLREGDVRRDDDAWLNFLQEDRATYERLLALRVLRPLDSGAVRWSFVGFLRTPKNLICSVPGAPKGDTIEFRVLRACLYRYFSESISRRPQTDEVINLFWRDSSAFAEIDAALTLVRFFADNGPFVTLRRQEARRGKLDWRRTMHTTAFVGTTGPFYPRLRFSRLVETATEITKVQLSLISEMLVKYRPVLDRPPGLADAIRQYGVFTTDQLQSEASRLNSIILAERTVTFRSDAMVMLDIMRFLLGVTTGGLIGSLALNLYGSSAFEYVWEDVCRDAVGDDAAIHSELAQPVWHFDSPSQSFPGGPQRPDIMFCDQQTLVIADAKYYFPVPPSVPGWQDIAKQLTYARSTEHTTRDIASLFMFPGDQDGLQRIGAVSVSSSSSSVGSVDVWKLGFVEAVKSYALRSAPHRQAFRVALSAQPNWRKTL